MTKKKGSKNILSILRIGEFDTPLSDFALRIYFLTVLETEVPEFLERLASDVFPMYSQARAPNSESNILLQLEQGCSFSDVRLQRFYSDLKRWSHRWGLSDAWLLTIFMATLEGWYTSPLRLKARRMVAPHFMDRKSAQSPALLDFRYSWLPLLEPRIDAEHRIQREFGRDLKKRLDAVEQDYLERGYKKSRRKRQTASDAARDFRWLIRYQVLKQSYTEILDSDSPSEAEIWQTCPVCGSTFDTAAECRAHQKKSHSEEARREQKPQSPGKEVSLDAVTKAIKATATLLGITLRRK